MASPGLSTKIVSNLDCHGQLHSLANSREVEIVEYNNYVYTKSVCDKQPAVSFSSPTYVNLYEIECTNRFKTPLAVYIRIQRDKTMFTARPVLNCLRCLSLIGIGSMLRWLIIRILQKLRNPHIKVRQRCFQTINQTLFAFYDDAAHHFSCKLILLITVL